MKLFTELRRSASKKVYLDANPFIYAVEGFAVVDAEIQTLFAAADRGELVIVTSEQTLSEVLVKPYQIQDAPLIAEYEGLLGSTPTLEVQPITRDILKSAAKIRAVEKKLRLPDAIHAATARLSQCDAFITNDANFKTFTGLTVVYLKEFLGL